MVVEVGGWAGRHRQVEGIYGYEFTLVVGGMLITGRKGLNTG